jgi:enediyne biosynthesis protein E4
MAFCNFIHPARTTVSRFKHPIIMNNIPRIILSFTLINILFSISCKQKKDTQPLFELVENSGVNFNNQVVDGKLENSFFFRNFYNGGGVAVGDINNDGLVDIFFTSNMGDNQIYLNKGNFKFEDITKSSGIVQDSMWSTGVVFMDINHDGWLDIYVCNSGHMTSGHRKNQLYINNHDLTFTESAAKYGLDISAYTTQVSFFDYDGDGDLDCFMIDNSPIPVNTLNNSNRRDLPDQEWPVENFLKGGGDHLYRNDNGHFTEVTKSAGIHGSLISFGLGVSVGDINGDGWPDVFVSNDSYERDYLYINQRDGTFKDEMEDWFGHTSFSSMGADIADINNDGYPEIFTTDMLPEDDYRLKTLGAFDNIDLYIAKYKAGFYHQYVKNCLQLNNRDGRFLDIANYAGVSATDWSWGALIFDMDNDGYNDIYVCNGVNKDVTNLDFMDFFANDVLQKMVLTGKKEATDEILKHVPVHPMLHKAYRNMGNLGFSDMGIEWGFIQASFANGASYADLDNDGDMDLIINNENGPAFIYKNNSRQQNKNNYIAVELKGIGENTFAIGSKIKVFQGSRIFYRELVPSRGFQSSVDYKQIIGLGKLAEVDSMVITWPNGSQTKFDHPAINKSYKIAETVQPAVPFTKEKITDSTLFSLVKSNFDKHEEDNNIDFYYEHNVPKMLSREGPRVAVGDVNGDGLEDVYIGGTSVHPGQLYLQTAAGKFEKKDEPGFALFKEFEDEAVLFFDADHDGDLDLFIGPGGNNSQPMSREMQNRLFKNDGHGNFTIDAAAFANNLNGVNTSVAVDYDFNHDGFPDLFVGGRSVPREYGNAPSSYLYLNDGKGHFTDIAATKNPDIAHIGMVTAASWANISGDANKDLIIAGEWMTPRIFSFKKDHFEELKTNLNNLSGWWESVAVADLNGDGKMDMVLGNIGENFYLRPDSARPVKLWVNDYDQNGNMDNILSRTIDGKDMPVFLKHDMEFQMPVLKKQNLKHGEFAKKTIQDMLPEELIKTSQVKKFNYCPSVVAINKGNGQFEIHSLPVMVQFSSVNAIRCADLNGDGYPDLVLGGNEFGFLPQFGRLDGSFGDVLINDGKGNFSFMENKKSGLNIRGMVRDIAQINGGPNTRMLFLVNDQYPVLYEMRGKRKN